MTFKSYYIRLCRQCYTMKNIILFFCLSFSLTIILPAQNTLGTISIEEGVSEGYTLTTVGQSAFLINNCGELINQWDSEYFPGVSVYLLPNGNLLRPGRLTDGSSNIGFGGRGGIVEMFDWEGNKIWEYRYSTNEFRQHHDVYPLPNGNILILAMEVVSDDDAIQLGRDPNLLTEGFLYNEKIIEVKPEGSSGGTIVWEWNVTDHLVQDFDSSKENFGIVSNAPGKININFLNGYDPKANWLHVNSIQYNEALDQIVISSRNLCEFWIIDHSTTTEEAASSSGGLYGKGGEILYRWGNPQVYDQGGSNNQRLYGQHTPYIIPNGLPNAGKILLFNNGVLRTPSYSQVFMLTPPTSGPGQYIYTPGQAFGPNNLDYMYPNTIPSTDSDFYSAIVSSAQQLPNGNILICEGREAIFFELDSDNHIVWKYLLPVSNADGTIYTQGGPPPENAFSFRATKYLPDYAAFIGRDLTPGDPLELNPDLSVCENLSNLDFNFIDFKVFPNPATDQINISGLNSGIKVYIHDVKGKQILMTTKKEINIEHLTNGLYFITIINGSKRYSTKLLKK